MGTSESKSEYSPGEHDHTNYDMEVEYYNNMDIEEKNKYMIKSDICKHYDLSHKELSNIKFIKVKKPTGFTYLYKITDIEMYLSENPRNFIKKDYINKNNALTIYQLEPDDLKSLNYKNRGLLKYYNINQVKEICIDKYPDKNIEDIVYEGNKNYKAKIKQRKKEKKERLMKQHEYKLQIKNKKAHKQAVKHHQYSSDMDITNQFAAGLIIGNSLLH